MYSPYSVSDIKKICVQHRIRPTKARGQNFLVDERIALSVTAAAGLECHRAVIEVGPGLGALTFPLAARARSVTAIEIDEKLSEVLESSLQEMNIANVRVINADVLRWWRQLDMSKFRNISSRSEPRGSTTGIDISIVASLPYAITSDFFSTVLRDQCLPRALTLVVQREVAERLAARPPHMSMLSVVAQWYGNVEAVMPVPRSAFWPQPDVESAVVRIDTEDNAVRARREGVMSSRFFSYVRRAFRYPRKKVGNTIDISRYQHFEIFDKRPSELSIEDWLYLYPVRNAPQLG